MLHRDQSTSKRPDSPAVRGHEMRPEGKPQQDLRFGPCGVTDIVALVVPTDTTVWKNYVHGFLGDRGDEFVGQRANTGQTDEQTTCRGGRVLVPAELVGLEPAVGKK